MSLDGTFRDEQAGADLLVAQTIGDESSDIDLAPAEQCADPAGRGRVGRGGAVCDPVRMLPLLLFESAWKLIWLGVVALPQWTDGRLDQATREVASECLLVVIILAVVPWRYVVHRYAVERGDRWR